MFEIFINHHRIKTFHFIFKIRDLQYELARVCKAHNDILRTYEAKLRQFGIPVEEIGFKPLESTVAGQQLGRGVAGLVTSPP